MVVKCSENTKASLVDDNLAESNEAVSGLVKDLPDEVDVGDLVIILSGASGDGTWSELCQL